MDTSKRRTKPNPRATASMFSVLTFWWLKDLFILGSKRDLELNDLYDTLEGDFSGDLGKKLEKNWKKELTLASVKGKRKPSLLKALSQTLFGQCTYLGIVLGFHIFVMLTAKPVLLGFLLQHFSPESAATTRKEAIGYGGGLITLLFLNVIVYHHCNMTSVHIGMRARIACCSLIYRKTIRLSKTALGQAVTGQMVNLLSNDVSRFDVLPLYMHYLWISPVETLIITYFIWKAVGWAAIIGLVGIFLQIVPVQTYMTKLTARLRLKVATRTDDRVRLMNEIITGIQVIKMYTWEKPFEKLVEIARRNELKALKEAAYLNGICVAFKVLLERTTLYITVIAYTLFGHTITADKVFSLAQFFNVLQLIMAIFYPMSVQYWAEAKVSISRIEVFLMQEEHVPKQPSPYVHKDDNLKEVDKDEKLGVVITNAFAKWCATSITETLTNINLCIKPGTLCAVVGPVGAGKTSLLQAIMQELPLSSGSIATDKTLSYASQEPWLFVGSVQHNILFGQPYDDIKYQEVVKVCALERDFELLPFRDKTLVGERGFSLSGGQRARISLARAVYRDADIYLLDDPLSAVDVHVAKQLFQDCINGYLRTKTCLLATHQLQYLKNADLVALINNGKLEYQGTFSDILANKTDFLNFIGSSQDESEISEESTVKLSKDNITMSSTKSSVYEENEESDEPEETAEMIERGKLRKNVHTDYFTAGSSYWLLGWLICVIVLGQFAIHGADYWVSYWTNQEELRMNLISLSLSTELSKIQNTTRNLSLANISEVSTTTTEDDVLTNHAETHKFLLILKTADKTEYTSTDDKNNITERVQLQVYNQSAAILENAKALHQENDANNVTTVLFLRQHYIIIYTICIGVGSILTVYRALVFVKVSLNSSQGLHNRMFNSILKGSMRFFETNPSGRVLNRFSKDMGVIDELLPRAMIDGAQIMLIMIGILIMVVIVNKYFLIVVVIFGPLLYKINDIYLQTAQNLKRLEGVTRSPVFSYLAASLTGLTTIRASASEDMVVKEFDNLQDFHTSSWYMCIAANTAFGFGLGLICTAFVSVVIISFLAVDTGTMRGYVGLAIAHSIVLTGMVQFGMKMMTEVFNQMTAVERVLQYNKIEKEALFESEPGKKPPIHWPQKGAIKFENLSLSYNTTGPPVLRCLNFTIEAGHKVGVVGRTGAGKSSLIAALFRLAKLEGAIYIDEINIQTIGLHDLRKHISIIPQEPVLFSETIRYNLDPFEEFQDSEIWSTLEEVGLKDTVDTLEYHVNEGGSNFSAGQKQLICLARAILRNNRILVLDEATANVDTWTDNFIQAKIRAKFEHCTVLTIAHRLNTVMDSDRILVMNSGIMMEYAHPFELLQNADGYFYKMVQQTGKPMEPQLRKVTQEAYKKRYAHSAT